MTGSLAKMASLERGVTLMDMPEANEYLMDPGYMECVADILDHLYSSPWTSIYSMEQRPVNVIVYRYLIWLINCVKDLGETGGALREQGFSMIFFYTTGTRTPGKQEIISMALPTRGQPWKMQNSILN